MDRRKALAIERAAQLRTDISLPSAPTILDYGSGVGTLKHALLTHWPFATVLEVDPGTIESVISPGTKVDLITLVHVLEHVYNPKEMLLVLKQYLKSGGMLYIEVPDFEVLTSHDYHIAHVWYFSEKTLSLLATSLGFSVTKVRHNTSLRAFSILLTL
jgi:2-polyprenyl-3-methyl-5-hydroxy-6-metoxy-1,4-benzoquinol methylase